MQPSRRFHRWRQFSLRTLLLVSFLVALACSWFAARMKVAERQRAAVHAIQEGGGHVAYDYEYDGMGYATKGAKPPGPVWLRDWLGIDFFADVVIVNCSTKRGREVVAQHLGDFPKLRSLDLYSMESVRDSDLAEIGKLRKLERLLLDSPHVSDVLMARISHARNMRYFVMHDSKVTDSGRAHLRHFTHLKELDLQGDKITSATLAHLQNLRELETLWLSNTQISDAGMEHLSGLVQLRYLGLGNTSITDASVPFLKALTGLTKLELRETYVTAKGAEELRLALPDCKVIWFETKMKAGASPASRVSK